MQHLTVITKHPFHSQRRNIANVTDWIKSMLAVNMGKAGVAKRLAGENEMELKKTQKKSLMVHSSIIEIDLKAKGSR